jgi:Kef-type K+ transport system membrane component KefB
MNVSLGAVARNLGLLAVLLAAKMLPKIGFIYPLARRADRRHATFTTLLMSTGLTFGTISSLYGLNAGIIDKTQFSLLVTVVVLSAIVPTAIAQRWFSPDVEAEQQADQQREARVSGGRTAPQPIPAGEKA